MRVTLVTTNSGKLREIRSILAEYGLQVTGQRRSLAEPQADDLETVVRAKLAQIPALAGPVLVDDSGLFLDGLGGFPGVYSAYALRTLGLDGILRLLEGRPRGASFRTVAGLREGRRVRLFPAEVRGSIADRSRGSEGFGYDPVFLPEGSSKTYGELPASVKNATSHRALAFRAVGLYFQRLARPG